MNETTMEEENLEERNSLDIKTKDTSVFICDNITIVTAKEKKISNYQTILAKRINLGYI